jgi:hypothetical protein
VTTRWPTPRGEPRGDPVTGVFWFDSYPAVDASPAEVEAWHAAFSEWCSARNVDPIAVIVEADRLGRADQPFSPY